MINNTLIQNLTTNEFIKIAHSNLTIPFLIILFVAFIIFLTIFAGITALTTKTALTYKFWMIYILTFIFTGCVLLILYLLPHSVLKFLNFIE